jgi:hypothetical protein
MSRRRISVRRAATIAASLPSIWRLQASSMDVDRHTAAITSSSRRMTRRSVSGARKSVIINGCRQGQLRI